MENVIYANGFEEHIEGPKICPPKTTTTGENQSRLHPLVTL